MRLFSMKVVINTGMIQAGLDKGDIPFGKNGGKMNISWLLGLFRESLYQVNITIFAPEKTFPEFRPA
jgi:hypothetical protein